MTMESASDKVTAFLFEAVLHVRQLTAAATTTTTLNVRRGAATHDQDDKVSNSIRRIYDVSIVIYVDRIVLKVGLRPYSSAMECCLLEVPSVSRKMAFYARLICHCKLKQD